MIEPADIRRLLDAFEQSDWDEIRLSVDGTEILISASDSPAEMPASTPRESAPAAVAEAAAAPAAPSTDTTAVPVTTVPQDIPEGAAVRSPSPGIFWRSPAPGAPPFVELGQHVEAEAVVCIVEVMKLMNRVVAGVSGTVAAILVENGHHVARDQALVIITPDSEGGT
jgi:acetyl-CoA carboxylase biotin carboxyl carrier protein